MAKNPSTERAASAHAALAAVWSACGAPTNGVQDAAPADTTRSTTEARSDVAESAP